MKLRSLFLLLRPHQWLKNIFVLLPLFFGKQLTNISSLFLSCIAVLSFCTIASSIYCLNDICDYEVDKKHPKKKHRPIASGLVSCQEAYIVMTLLAACSFLLLFIWGGNFKWQVISIVLIYFILNIAYCIKLKKLALIDVLILSSGFVIRVMAGGVISNIYLSHWIILMTFLIALFLAIAKRRDDVIIYEKTKVLVRESTVKYNLPFLNLILSMIGTITLVCYIMYVVSNEIVTRFNSQYVYLTTLFVLAGIIRYLQLTIVFNRSGNPTDILLKDHFLQSCIICWFIMFFIFIYI